MLQKIRLGIFHWLACGHIKIDPKYGRKLIKNYDHRKELNNEKKKERNDKGKTR